MDLQCADSSKVELVTMGHYGGKSRFSIVINDRAMHIEYHAYMTLDKTVLEKTDAKNWKLLNEAIANSDLYANDRTSDNGSVSISIQYSNGEIKYGNFKWDGDTKNTELAEIYKKLLAIAK
jgi:hypothetical protein